MYRKIGSLKTYRQIDLRSPKINLKFLKNYAKKLTNIGDSNIIIEPNRSDRSSSVQDKWLLKRELLKLSSCRFKIPLPRSETSGMAKTIKN